MRSARHRSTTSRAVLGAVALAALLALVGCGDDPDPVVSGSGSRTTAGPEGAGDVDGTEPEAGGSGEPASEADREACAALEGTVLQEADAPLDDEASSEEEDPAEVADRFSALADHGPEAIRDEARTLAELAALDEDEATDADVVRYVETLDALHRWGVESCPAESVWWACATRRSFRPVGESIGGPGSADEDLPEPSGDGPSTPEEAVGETDPDGATERVELRRTEDEVLFAWLDEEGLVVQTVQVVGGGGGWVRGADTECADPSASGSPEKFETIPAPVDPEDVPPSSSVPTGG